MYSLLSINRKSPYVCESDILDPISCILNSLHRDLNLGKVKSRKLSGQESECSGEVESSAIEADQGALEEDNRYNLKFSMFYLRLFSEKPFTSIVSCATLL